MAEDPEVFDLAALGLSLRKEAEGTPEREAYLERLRQQIKRGEYRADSEALARKLIENLKKESEPGGGDHSEDLEK